MSSLQGTLVKTPDGMTDAFAALIGPGAQFNHLAPRKKTPRASEFFPAWSSVFSYP
ncbi:hypothetical protein [Paenibacillus elgii]|uniref:hypothetical protein n=1 Tax=Paenibacillus elgii TaxID=189691 RepID=UPI0012FAA068|nr:hypothetical protein [Paenibacillus elgii]NEN82267.1 hypothetical protein [Paenibacillus elgii]